MPNNNKITTKAVGDLLDYNFFIPSYQRGYRWDERQVKDLLNDILEFQKKKDKGFYCLQPIVVKPIDKDKYEVIDGQQRLTTIYLILKYLGKDNLFSIEYETRKKSKEFLESISPERKDENIDFSHIYKAYQTIGNWFNDNNKNDFLNTLKSHVKVIWYELDPAEDPIDVFTRINSGKIPLTNAELIKALFLNSSNFNTKASESLRLKQLEIATEWDRIEYKLQDNGFWYFLTNKDPLDYQTRIDLLFEIRKEFEIIKAKETEKETETESKQVDTNDHYHTFHYFAENFIIKDKEKLKETWKQIKRTFQILEEWYNDKELYHLVGYLLAIEKGKISDILKYAEGKSKTGFKSHLKDKIKPLLPETNFEELDYNKDKSKIKQILLLFNVITAINSKNETTRFLFDKYKTENWDIEHIHALASEVNVKKDDLAEWIKDNYVEGANPNNPQIDNAIGEFLQNGKTIDDLIAAEIKQENESEEDAIQRIIEHVLGNEEINGLENLCLLDSHTNREYKNAAFKKKRQIIIEKDKLGTFILPCTRNVFLKYYTENPKSLDVWNKDDKEAYLKAIKTTLNEFLSTSENNNEK